MPPLIDSLIVLAILITLARFIKRGSRTLQRLFIPSALIAGVGGLVLGPQLLDAIPADVTKYWEQLPKYLISVVFAGLFLGKTIPNRKEVWRTSGPMIAFGNVLAWGQYVLGIAATMFFLTPLFGVNPLAGSLIEISFEGGHGTSAGLASSFAELGWSEGTDIALVLATISLIGAIISGVVLVNWRNRKHGYLIDEQTWKEQERTLIRSGYNLVRFGQKINTKPKSVALNIFAFGCAIGLGIAMLQSLIYLENIVLGDSTNLRFMSYVPLFPFAMIGGLLVQLFLRKIKQQHLVQRRTAQIISTIALDILIASAVATISLSAVRANLPVVITFSVIGIVWILFGFAFLARRMFNDYWFENGITNTGQSMGMTATGLLMNRLADPTNKSGAREAFGYKQLAFEPFMGGGLVTATSVVVIAEFGSWFALVTAMVFALFWLVVGLRVQHRKQKVSSPTQRHF